MDNDKLEGTVQKHVNIFCKTLPGHVEKWRIALSDIIKPANALVNYAEQLRHVERCNIKYIEDFPTIQENLLHKIYNEIEFEISLLNDHLDQLSKTNQEIRNKLTVLERSTTDLNWESNSILVLGNALQPPLSRILQDGLNFCLYFTTSLRLINEHVKTLNVRDAKSMGAFKDSLKVDLEIPAITMFLAITQYVNNEKLLV